MLDHLLRVRTFVAVAPLAVLMAVGCSGGGGRGGAASTVAPTTSGTSPTTSGSTTGAFVNVPPLAEARVYHTATLLANGKVLIVGGQTGATTVAKTTEVFDPATGQVTAGPSLATARMNHAAILLGTQKVLVVGGQSDVAGHVALDTCEVYDPQANTWSAGPKLSEARSLPAIAAYKDNNVSKALVAGGASFKAGFPTSLKTADVILVDASPMTVTASTALMAEDRFGASASAQSNGQVLIQGGYSAMGAGAAPKPSQSEVYDIKNAVFVAVPTLAPRAESALASLGTDSYASGGTDGTAALGSVEAFNGQTWSAGTALAQARQGHTATTLTVSAGPSLPAQMTVIMVAGGVSSGSALDSGEIVSSATATPAATAKLNVARAYHTATALQNGMVVLAGGVDAGGNILSSIEVYTYKATAQVPGSTTSPGGTAVPGGTVGHLPPIPPTPPPGSVTIASISPTSGAVGTAVQLTGTGFDATPANNIVKFNGVAATVATVDVTNPAANTLSCMVPASATTGPVTLEVAAQTATGPVFTVTGGPTTPTNPPRILFVLPNAGKMLFPVSITGQDFGPQPIATFNGVPTINIISLSTKSLPFIGSVSELIVIVPPGATTGPLTVTNQGLVSNPFNFTVN